ncbi:unnamed protein product, partial [Mesorhabditis belari]|uniref:Nucleolar complex protein 2 homolog n=1 Tax=Mesorhabditis belari TaxID=2138241 RepID=A0AAF3F1P1_9BILA
MNLNKKAATKEKKKKKKLVKGGDDSKIANNKETSIIDKTLSDLSDEEEVLEGNGDKVETSAQHKKDLEKIRKADPEFYKFLQEQEADLLEFNESDEESENEEDEETPKSKEKMDQTGKPKLTIDKNTGRQVFDRNWYEYLEKGLNQEDVRHNNVKLAVAAFAACVARTGADVTPPQWIINDEKVFDAVVRVCFSDVGSLIYKLLGEKDVKTEEEDIGADQTKTKRGGKINFKHWRRYSKLAKEFLTSLLRFLNEIQSHTVILATLKTMIPLVDLYGQFAKLNRLLIKTVCRIWTRKTLDCRVIAFVLLNKIVKRDADVFAHVYKTMYLGFVSNARHVSSETWSLLQFMQRSFAEMSVLYPDIAYQYAFTYIRQIAIHLRNAQIGKKRKDLVQTVYNWQLMQCQYLWAQVVSKSYGTIGADALRELSYPLAQIVIATLKLFPSIRFLPLRFHCLSILIQLQVNCDIYVPTLALGCELLPDLLTLSQKKPRLGKGVVKQIDMDSQLRASAQQTEEAGWRQSIGDTLFRILLQASHVLSAHPSFPDVVLPITHKLRAFCKECRNPDFVRLYRSLLDKLTQHSNWTLSRLSSTTLDLQESTTLANAQERLTDPSSPVAQYHAQFSRVWKMRAAALQRNDSLQTKKEMKPKEVTPKKEEKEIEVTSTEKESMKTSQPANKSKVMKKKQSKRNGVKKPDSTLTDQVLDLNEMEWSD